MELNTETLNSVNIKVQEFLFTKSNCEEVTSFLVTHVYKILIQYSMFL